MWWPADPCTDEELLNTPNVVLVDADGVKYRLGPVVVTGADIGSARVVAPTAGQPHWSVNFRLTPDAARRFDRATERLAEILPPRQIATIVHGRVVEAPTVESPAIGRSGQIGNLTEAQARSLVARLS